MTLRDGTLHFDATGDVVGPGMTGEAFMQLRFVTEAGYRSGTYGGTAQLGQQQVEGKRFFVSFDFRKGQLVGAELCLDIETPPGREDWAKETELERKAAHEAWCAEQLGEPLEPLPSPGPEGERMYVRTLPWGTIRSIYDARGGCSFVRIEYAR